MKTPDFTSRQHSTNATCRANEITSLTTPLYSGALPPFAHKHISAARLIEVIGAALDVISSAVDEEDDYFMVAAEKKSSSMKKKNDDDHDDHCPESSS
jgi:hypothetical protein